MIVLKQIVSCNSQINRSVVQGYRKYQISRVTKHKLKLKLGIRAGQHPTDKVSQKNMLFRIALPKIKCS